MTKHLRRRHAITSVSFMSYEYGSAASIELLDAFST